jgi:hypothetical protein
VGLPVCIQAGACIAARRSGANAAYHMARGARPPIISSWLCGCVWPRSSQEALACIAMAERISHMSNLQPRAPDWRLRGGMERVAS